MLSQTHWLIGDTVAQIAAEQIPGRINKLAFCWGNVLPDLVRPYSIIPHTINGSGPLLTKLLGQTQLIQFKGPWTLYVHLGIISHLLSDYFCLAHNEPSLEAVVPHVIYEAKLHSSINGRRLRNLALATLKTRGSEACELRRYLEVKHQDYKNEAPGPLTDVAYALNAVLGLIYSLPEPAGCRRGVFSVDLGRVKTAGNIFPAPGIGIVLNA
ncbi:MAG: zinc dependent phospholipase C family protein [Syntrophomonas sp.]